MSSVIDFDAAAAEREARRLEEAARMLRQISRRTENALETASRAWQGVQSNSYRRKGEALRAEVEDSERKMRRLAEDVREVIREMEALERENRSIAGRSR
ncbi:MAG: hypothetical protein IJ617_00800 [Oscillospiraceae bacterium]|nr:hypothetical protein [Oscillospiraceae bacterium]